MTRQVWFAIWPQVEWRLHLSPYSQEKIIWWHIIREVQCFTKKNLKLSNKPTLHKQWSHKKITVYMHRYAHAWNIGNEKSITLPKKKEEKSKIKELN